MWSPRGEPADVVRSMDAAGVRLACFAHDAPLGAPGSDGRQAIEIVRAFPQRFRAYLSVNPHYPELVERDLPDCDSMPDVYVGLKFLPDYHEVKLSDERYRPALEFAQERGLLLLCHTYDGSSFNGPAEVRRLVENYPNIRFLMAHCVKSNWVEAAAIAREHPNVYLELTGVLGQGGAVDILCQQAGSQKMLFGTDQPWYGQHQGIGHLLSADITDEDIHNICHRNASKLLGL
jgi:predicted TIM-barrel fold metal-dependent hydrolase